MWDYKDPSEIITMTFDFTAELNGAAIQSVEEINIAVVEGEDPSPADMLDGFLPQVSGAQVLHQAKDGLSGVKYYVECLALLSDGRKLLRWDILPVLDRSENQ